MLCAEPAVSLPVCGREGLEQGVCGVGGVVELERGHLLGVWAESTRRARQRRAERESMREGESAESMGDGYRWLPLSSCLVLNVFSVAL